jgi:hypothetical protein
MFCSCYSEHGANEKLDSLSSDMLSLEPSLSDSGQ